MPKSSSQLTSRKEAAPSARARESRRGAEVDGMCQGPMRNGADSVQGSEAVKRALERAPGPATILLVEDNDEVRGLLALFMKRLGYTVFEAATGLEAIDRASTAHPDLILMDLRLPGMNGDDVTAQLKATPSTRDIPVLITTGYLAARQVKRAFDSGAAEVLYKPIDVTLLRDVLRRYLSKRTRKRRSPRKS